jgi:hypothetical protein
VTTTTVTAALTALLGPVVQEQYLYRATQPISTATLALLSNVSWCRQVHTAGADFTALCSFGGQAVTVTGMVQR